MSKMKELYVDIEELLSYGLNEQEIVDILFCPNEFVRQVMKNKGVLVEDQPQADMFNDVLY